MKEVTNQYISKGRNIFIIGATRIGKSNLTCALESYACLEDKGVIYIWFSDLIVREITIGKE